MMNLSLLVIIGILADLTNAHHSRSRKIYTDFSTHRPYSDSRYMMYDRLPPLKPIREMSFRPPSRYDDRYFDKDFMRKSYERDPYYDLYNRRRDDRYRYAEQRDRDRRIDDYGYKSSKKTTKSSTYYFDANQSFKKPVEFYSFESFRESSYSPSENIKTKSSYSKDLFPYDRYDAHFSYKPMPSYRTYRPYQDEDRYGSMPRKDNYYSYKPSTHVFSDTIKRLTPSSQLKSLSAIIYDDVTKPKKSSVTYINDIAIPELPSKTSLYDEIKRSEERLKGFQNINHNKNGNSEHLKAESTIYSKNSNDDARRRIDDHRKGIVFKRVEHRPIYY